MGRYICLRCFYEWESTLQRQGIRCPRCHTRQGVDITKFNQAVDGAEEALTGFPIPPHPATALSAISSLVKTINDSVTEQFPDPLLPPRVAVEVWNRAVERIDRNRQQQGT